jgi:hypothetical protein
MKYVNILDKVTDIAGIAAITGLSYTGTFSAEAGALIVALAGAGKYATYKARQQGNLGNANS